MQPAQQVPSAAPPSGGGAARHPIRHWAAVALFAVLAAASLALWRTGALDLAAVRARVAHAGAVGPVVFVAAYAAVTLLPVPKNVLSVAAGALFGFGPGTALVWLAAMLGAVAAFAVARAVDPGALSWVVGRHRDRVIGVLHRYGLASVLVARLLPVAPFTAVNYVGGMSPVRRRDFVLGTAVGILPGTVVYVAVGAYGLSRPDTVVLAASALLALTVAGGVAARRLRTSGSTPAAQLPDTDRSRRE